MSARPAWLPLLVALVLAAEAGVTRAQEEPPTGPIVIRQPPLAARITVGEPGPEGVATVSGAAGALEGSALVGAGAVDVAWIRFIEAAEDGSFSAEIFAPAGSHVQVKHARP